MSDQTRRNPFDDLSDHLNFCLGIAPNKVIEVFAKELERAGIRVVLAAVSDDWTHPQVEVTATADDVTAKVVAQVVDPVLHKVGVPPNMVLMLSAAAGEAAVRFLRRQRQDNERTRQYGATTRGSRPAWDPSRIRRRRGEE